MRTRRLPKDVTPEQFVRVWQSAKNLHVVTRDLDMEPREASGYAAYLRSKGVALKKFQTNSSAIDFEALKKIATGE